MTEHKFPSSHFLTSVPCHPLPPFPPTSAAKKFKKLAGKETYSETLESTPTMEKEKFPQDYFPEVGHVSSIKPPPLH